MEPSGESSVDWKQFMVQFEEKKFRLFKLWIFITHFTVISSMKPKPINLIYFEFISNAVTDMECDKKND